MKGHLLVLCLFSASVFAQNEQGWKYGDCSGQTFCFYVDNSGSDFNSGFSEGSPFRTLAKAFSVIQTRGGSTNWVLNMGNVELGFVRTPFIIPKSITSGTIVQKPGCVVTATSLSSTIFSTNDTSRSVTFDGVTFQGPFWSRALWDDRTPTGSRPRVVYFLNCVFREFYDSIVIFSNSRLTVTNCTFENTGLGYRAATLASLSEVYITNTNFTNTRMALFANDLVNIYMSNVQVTNASFGISAGFAGSSSLDSLTFNNVSEPIIFWGTWYYGFMSQSGLDFEFNISNIEINEANSGLFLKYFDYGDEVTYVTGTTITYNIENVTINNAVTNGTDQFIPIYFGINSTTAEPGTGHLSANNIVINNCDVMGGVAIQFEFVNAILDNVEIMDSLGPMGTAVSAMNSTLKASNVLITSSLDVHYENLAIACDGSNFPLRSVCNSNNGNYSGCNFACSSATSGAITTAAGVTTTKPLTSSSIIMTTGSTSGPNSTITDSQINVVSGKSKSSNNNAIIAACVSLIFILIIITIVVIVIIFFVMRKKEHKSTASGNGVNLENSGKAEADKEPTSTGPYSNINVRESRQTSFIVAGNGKQARAEDFDELELEYSKLRVYEQIGIGSFGEVMRGDYNGTDVAIKKISEDSLSTKNTTFEKVLSDFKAEANVMKSIPSHPNIVLFLGMTTNPLSMVLEYCPGGSLRSYLNSKFPITSRQKISIARDIARGMYHLHTSKKGMQIIHRDLAARNVLVKNSDLTCAVSDFGMARMRNETEDASKTYQAVGPLKWMAPEAITSQNYSIKTDIWSYGVVLFELVTRGDPWPNMNPTVAVASVLGKKKMDIPTDREECPQVLATIMDMCWQYEPGDRPTFKDIMDVFKQMEEKPTLKNQDSKFDIASYSDAYNAPANAGTINRIDGYDTLYRGETDKKQDTKDDTYNTLYQDDERAEEKPQNTGDTTYAPIRN